MIKRRKSRLVYKYVEAVYPKPEFLTYLSLALS